MKVGLLKEDYMAIGRLVLHHPDLYGEANNLTPPTGHFTSKEKDRIGEMNKKYREQISQWAMDANAAMESEDHNGVLEIWNDIKDDQAETRIWWQQLETTTKDFIKEQP